jgi:hypothetical protein
MMTRRTTAVGLILVLIAIPRGASADIAFDNAANVPANGIQNWVGNLGLDFIVSSPVTVTQLGAFDNGDTANLSGTVGAGVTVGIFDVTSGLLAAPSVIITPSSVGSQINGDFLVDVTPFDLSPGTYSIVTLNDANYNTGFGYGVQTTMNDGGGLLDFASNPSLTARWDTGSGFEFPVSSVANPHGANSGEAVPVPRFAAGTFAFQAAATVPEPASLAMWASMIALAMCGRCRKFRPQTS